MVSRCRCRKAGDHDDINCMLLSLLLKAYNVNRTSIAIIYCSYAI